MVRDFINDVICYYIKKRGRDRNPKVICRYLKINYGISCSESVINKRCELEECSLNSKSNIG